MYCTSNGNLIFNDYEWLEQLNKKDTMIKWDGKYRHRRMDFNHTSSHSTYVYDTNIHVWVWHEWEVWLELWLKHIINEKKHLKILLETN